MSFKKCLLASLLLFSSVCFAEEICKVSRTPFGKLIRQKESGGHYGAWNEYKTNSSGKRYLVSHISGDGKNLTNMTLAAIVEEQKQGIMNAVGAYQIINTTDAPVLNEAIRYLSLNPLETYSKELQDHIFDDYLTKYKRSALHSYFYGNGDIDKAALQAAQEWASMPVKKGTKRRRGDIATSNCNMSYYGENGIDSSTICYETLIEAMKVSREQLQSGTCNPEKEINKDKEAKEAEKQGGGNSQTKPDNPGGYKDINVGVNPGGACGGCIDWGLGAQLGNKSLAQFQKLDTETFSKVEEIVSKINTAHQNLELQSKDILETGQKILQLQDAVEKEIHYNQNMINSLQDIINSKDATRGFGK